MPGILSGFIVASAIAAATANAATLVVGQPNTPCPHAHYSTIGAAIEAAAPGDTIDICPAVYPEQLTISKPLTLRGIEVNGVKRVLIQPSVMVASPDVDAALGGQLIEAVITVTNTGNVTLRDLAIDASNNQVNGCSPLVTGVHYYNASGQIENSAISGAQAAGCAAANVLQGSGTGVQIDADPAQNGLHDVEVEGNTIEKFSRNGILAVGSGVTANIRRNAVSGQGPGGGVFQFGIFLLNGATGAVQNNVVHEGPCGALSAAACLAARTEGIVLRNVADGAVVDGNTIVSAQSGIFLNGGNNVRVLNNTISDIDLLDGIDIQGAASGFFTNSQIANNTVLNVGPITNQGCGIFEVSASGVSGNIISNNTVKDGYCGVAAVSADQVVGGNYANTLYTVLNTDQPLPSPAEP